MELKWGDVEWGEVDVAPETSGPVHICPPRYRSPASLRASAQRCPLCGLFRPKGGRCVDDIYIHSYGVWEHR